MSESLWAVSNPCFEYWLLLHIESVKGAPDRDACIAPAKTHAPLRQGQSGHGGAGTGGILEQSNNWRSERGMGAVCYTNFNLSDLARREAEKCE